MLARRSMKYIGGEKEVRPFPHLWALSERYAFREADEDPGRLGDFLGSLDAGNAISGGARAREQTTIGQVSYGFPHISNPATWLLIRRS